MALKLVFACLALVTIAVCDEVVPVPVVPHLMPAAQPCGRNQSLLLPGIGQKGLLQQFVFGSMEKRQSCQPGYGECLSTCALAYSNEVTVLNPLKATPVSAVREVEDAVGKMRSV